MTEHLDRDLAIKILPAELLADDKARQQFRKEAHALSRLNHPNVATVYDFDSCHGIDYLAEELVLGTSLDEMLSSGPLSEKEIANLGTQLCEGLAAAHAHGILHRDIKPGNLRVTPEDHLKILDFGLAETVAVPGIANEKQATLSETQTTAGTLPYMAPEQLRNERLDARTDIWAAGCVLYEMATAHRPFPGQGTALVNEILNQTPTQPSKLNHKISAGMEAIIQKCLEKDPALRCGSAHEIAIDLRRLSASATVAPATRRRRAVFDWKLSLIALVVIVVIGLAAWAWLHRRAVQKTAPPAQIPPSIAVLPFADMSPAKDQEYFADGLAEELLNDLAKIPELRVTARTSSFQFKGKDEDPRVIGAKLNVGSVLEGSVRKQGDRLRITAELINAADGFHLWSETYDRNLKDVFAVQEEIARSVAGSLKLKLLGTKPSSPQPTTPEAYNAYLQGRYFQQKRTTESLERAMVYYQQAIKLDPSYAPVWAELSVTRYLWADNNVKWPEKREQVERAREEASRALSLDPNLPQAYTASAHIKMVYDWDWSGADADMQKALALNPGDENTLWYGALLAAAMNRFDEALGLQRRVVEINPLSAAAYHELGFLAWWANRPEEAIQAIQKAMELNPEFPFLHNVLAWAYLEQGRPEAALAEAQLEKLPTFHLENLALAYHALGRKRESDQALAELIAKYEKGVLNGYITAPYEIAQVYAFRGEPDRAFEWPERAYASKEGEIACIKGDPMLKNLRGDPRYRALLKKMHLAD
jgi:eukaryotic-like serine/threonine-protein kinase